MPASVLSSPTTLMHPSPWHLDTSSTLPVAPCTHCALCMWWKHFDEGELESLGSFAQYNKVESEQSTQAHVSGWQAAKSQFFVYSFSFSQSCSAGFSCGLRTASAGNYLWGCTGPKFLSLNTALCRGGFTWIFSQPLILKLFLLPLSSLFSLWIGLVGRKPHLKSSHYISL